MRRVTQRIRALCVAGLVGFVGPGAAQEIALTVAGNDADIKTRLTNASLIFALDSEGPQTAQDFIAAARADYRRMLVGLYTLGHYGGTVSITVDGREVSQISPLHSPAQISRIAINVDPGPAFTFGRAVVAPLPENTTLPEGFQSGAPALSRSVKDATSASIDAWRAAGHAKARVAQDDIVAHHPTQTLDAVIGLAPGPLLRFGPLVVTGQKAMRPDRIREIAGLPVGSVYDPDDLALATERLRRTGVFRSVALSEAEHYSGDFRLPIEAQVDERKPRRIGAGLEYSNVDGVTLSAFWLHRNLLGGAERFRIDGEIAGITGSGDDTDYSVGVRLDRPATFNPENALFAYADYDWIKDPGYHLNRREYGLGLTRIVNEHFSLTAGVSLAHARVEDALGSRDYTLLSFPLEATLDKRDDQRNATEGYYLSVTATPFLGLDGSDNGARLTGDARVYRSFGSARRVTLAGRLQLGSVVGPEARDAPADFLFFSGGGGTVRGQAYQSLGQTLPEGDVIGGRSFLGGSLEARVPLRGAFGAVGFYDIGVISDDPMPGKSGHSHAGAGIGVRYDTRLGPIRFDVATPVGDARSGKDVQFYIGIGQAF